MGIFLGTLDYFAERAFEALLKLLNINLVVGSVRSVT
jgi:hypothetical protein